MSKLDTASHDRQEAKAEVQMLAAHVAALKQRWASMQVDLPAAEQRLRKAKARLVEANNHLVALLHSDVSGVTGERSASPEGPADHTPSDACSTVEAQ